MGRTIDADKLLKKLFPYGGIDKKTYSINAYAVYTAIVNSHAADVEEVVRCKDCKHFEEPMLCHLRKVEVLVARTDFCSYGKKKHTEESDERN